jgi:hypothetical protein
MDHILRLRATQYRPPADLSPLAEEDATLTLAHCTVVATDVPYWRAPASAAIRRAEFGLSQQSDYTGFTQPHRDVQVRDIFVVGGDADAVQSIANIGTHLRAFGVARIEIS